MTYRLTLSYFALVFCWLEKREIVGERERESQTMPSEHRSRRWSVVRSGHSRGVRALHLLPLLVCSELPHLFVLTPISLSLDWLVQEQRQNKGTTVKAVR